MDRSENCLDRSPGGIVQTQCAIEYEESVTCPEKTAGLIRSEPVEAIRTGPAVTAPYRILNQSVIVYTVIMEFQAEPVELIGLQSTGTGTRQIGVVEIVSPVGIACEYQCSGTDFGPDVCRVIRVYLAVVLQNGHLVFIRLGIEDDPDPY
jgi:hypothetical protein